MGATEELLGALGLVVASAAAKATPDQTRLALAMAVVRVVNLAVEEMQTREYAQSVAALAGRMGLPGWIVAVRHDATHTGLPALEVLTLAAEQCLVWLEKRYWKPQEELARAFVAPTSAFAVEDVVRRMHADVVEGNIRPVAGPALPPSSSAAADAASGSAVTEPTCAEQWRALAHMHWFESPHHASRAFVDLSLIHI